MMGRKKIITATLLAGAAFAAGETAGNVTATKGLQLNGQAVPVAGTKSWPVGTGDELKSDATPVVLTMKDGSRIVLGKNSQAKVEAGTVRLLAGSMEYQLVPRSTLHVALQNDVLPNRTGVISTVKTGQAPTPVVLPSLTAGRVTGAGAVTTEALPPPSRRAP